MQECVSNNTWMVKIGMKKKEKRKMIMMYKNIKKGETKIKIRTTIFLVILLFLGIKSKYIRFPYFTLLKISMSLNVYDTICYFCKFANEK